MRTKLITLRYSESLGGFDDTPLLEFTRDQELTGFREVKHQQAEASRARTPGGAGLGRVLGHHGLGEERYFQELGVPKPEEKAK